MSGPFCTSVKDTYSSPFYAYVKDRYDPDGNRYVITFASRDAADSWWRAVYMLANSELTTTAARASRLVRRITPHYYTFDYSTGSRIYQTILDQSGRAPEFPGVFFTALPPTSGYPGSIIPQQDIVDHVNGGTFFIRSRDNPRAHWWVADDKKVYASENRRTRFRINVRGKKPSEAPVMVGSDQVEIRLAFGSAVVSTDQDTACLVTNKRNPTVYQFSEFDGGFMVYDAKGPGSCDCSDGTTVADSRICQTSDGESWELV